MYSSLSWASTRSSDWIQLSDAPLDLISVLAVAQRLEVDILPIVWQPALETLGLGSTAEIRQSLINVQLSLAFKCVKQLEVARWGTARVYHNLICEISTLAHPPIREHPNIITLEGICWDIWSDGQVWPVLVFEKTHLGNLAEFLRSDEGSALSFEARIRLCADIASGLEDIHSCYVIHGDIKPENVLVFWDDNRYVAKIADFGYSMLLNDRGLIDVPRSEPWCAPEHHHRGFDLPSAKQMDIFSFGMLCVWVLFHDEPTCPSLSELENLKKGDEQLISEAQSLSKRSTSASDHLAQSLCQLYQLSLACEPMRRSQTFSQISQLLGRKKSDIPLPMFAPGIEPVARFSIGSSLYQFYMTDYRVRRFLVHVLTERATEGYGCKDHEVCDANFELAVCCQLGFGIPRDLEQASRHLGQSVRPREHLNDEMNHFRQLPEEMRQNKFTDAAAGGYLGPLDFSSYGREHSHLEHLRNFVEEEIVGASVELGQSHPVVLRLKTFVARVLRESGDLSGAMQVLTEVVDLYNLTLGSEAPPTLGALDALAILHICLGHYDEAEALANQACRTSERLNGPDYPHTLMYLSTLQLTLESQGKLEAAEEVGRRTLQGMEKAFGAEHPRTITSANNLGLTLHSQGNYQAAEAVMRDVLHRTEKVLGSDHADSLNSLSNLASLLGSQGRFQDAADIQSQLIRKDQQVFGTHHLQTMTDIHNMSANLYRQGKFQESRETCELCLERREVTLGPEHPHTISSLSLMALILGAEGADEEEERYGRLALERCNKVLGSEHPQTLTMKSNLALALHSQNLYQEAEAMSRQALEARERVLGPQHPATLTTSVGLALILYSQKRHAEAEALCRQILPCMQSILGSKHVETMSTRGMIADILYRRGSYTEAGNAFNRLIADKTEVLGPEHSSTLMSMDGQAMVWERQGKCGAAEEMHRRVLEGRIRALGAEHPLTATSRESVLALQLKQK